MFLPLLLLVAHAQHDHSQHLSPEQISAEVAYLGDMTLEQIGEYFEENQIFVRQLERAEAEKQKTTPEELEQWYTDNIRDYYEAVDRILLGNQVCNWKFAKQFEKCIVADFFGAQEHGRLRHRGDTYRTEFNKEAKTYIHQLERGHEL